MFSDDETDEKRVVRSAKEKRYEALYANIKTIKNCKKTKDFNQMLSSFEELQKNFDKAKPIIAKEENGVTPRFFLRVLVEIEDLVNETWEDSAGRKNLSKINGKSLGALRQKIRKYIRDTHDDDVAKFRENPDADDDEQEEAGEEEGSGDDDDDFREKSVEKEVKKKKIRDDDDDDSDDWDSDTESDSSSDDDIASTSVYTREMFLKKVEDPEKARKKKEKEEKKKQEREERKLEEKRKRLARAEDGDSDDEDEGEGWTKVDKTAGKVAMFAKDAEITNELVINKLAEITAARGKKKTNRKEQIELLNELAGIGQENQLGPGIHMKIKFAIIAALFDYNPKLSDAMKPDSWEKCMKGVEELLDLLDEQVTFYINTDQ